MKNFAQRLQHLEEQWQELSPETDPLPAEEDEEGRINSKRRSARS